VSDAVPDAVRDVVPDAAPDTVRGIDTLIDPEIRQAGPNNINAVKAVTDAAYHHYIARIGVVPQPMEADHAANVAAGHVFVTVRFPATPESAW